MPAELTMPQQSDTMTEGTVVAWRKKEGDAIKEGEVVAEIETDKATMEMEAFEAGTLAVVLAKEGQKVAVGRPIGIIARKGENPADVKKQYAAGSGAGGAAKPQAAQQAGGSATATAVVSAPKHNDQGGAITFEGASTGEMHEPGDAPGHGATREKPQAVPPVPTSGNGENRTRISPLAKRIAAEKGVDVAQVQGSGPGGRIVQKDVLAAAEKPVAKPQAAEKAGTPALPARVGSGQSEKIALSKMRVAIATALQRSKQNVPHFYETMDIDVEELSKLRERLNAKLEKEKVRLSVGDFVTQAVAAALKRHPILNATFDGAKNEITRYGDVNLGIAVALPDGLIVPVLRGVDQMGLKEIRQRSVDIVERARAQKLKGDEMKGATFTVSNLGAYGVREFMAIVNPPEVGILAVGAAEKRAVVKGDQIVARTMMTVTLSADHR
ncbi:MAG TPA: dihydrolipoamide acetyltransferase family protein, partial [Tepidisphaeraceae bacterium]|nr:dihydrolipoamide acetyltransferase family protein [Tepidisphaeraceae bacterium]